MKTFPRTTVRTATPADYPALVAVGKASYPDYAETVEELRHWDKTWDHSKYFKLRLVAEDAAPVDEDPVVLADLPQRSQHRDVTRVVDVQSMDLRERRGPDADLHHAAADRIEESLALQTREDLGVVHLADELRVRRDHARRRDDRPR